MTLKLKDFLTLGNLSMGLLSVLSSVYGFANYASAFVLLVIAVVFDFLDGKVARMTKPDEFGKQLDSLADLASFGIAAPVVAFFFFGTLLDAFGVVVFACCTAIRLARFNLQKEKGFFFGLPSPVAALALLAVAPFAKGYLFLPMILLGFLMVSGFRVKKL